MLNASMHILCFMDDTTGLANRLTVANVDRHLIERLYSRFASVYDAIFGSVLDAGRREAMRELEVQPGDEILEIGVGTGLTAALYPADCRVTGIDLSESMLRRAARQLVSQDRRNIHLRRMDASRLAFPDQSFDVVYAAYVISVVPDPVAVLREMRRVCRVGGRIVLLNHFRSTSPILATFERLISAAHGTRRLQSRPRSLSSHGSVRPRTRLGPQSEHARNLVARSLFPLVPSLGNVLGSSGTTGTRGDPLVDDCSSNPLRGFVS